MRHFSKSRSWLSVAGSFGLVSLGLIFILGLFVAVDFAQRFAAYRDNWGELHLHGAARHTFLSVFHHIPHPRDDLNLENCGLPVYELRIRTKDLNQLRQTAEKVNTARYAEGISREYVPAKFLVDGRWIDLNVKLRGQTYVHYTRNRPSFRLKFPKNSLFHGKRIINLTVPSDKGVTQDITSNWELARYGFLTWESQFVVLKVNGQVMGVFQEIEQIGQAMADRSLRSEGYFFETADTVIEEAEGLAWHKAKEARAWFMACEDQVDTSPLTGPCDWTSAQAYLDTDKFAWAAALTTLLGSNHAWGKTNIRLYYDPARGTLEPVPWDYQCYRIKVDSSLSPTAEPIFGDVTTTSAEAESCRGQCAALLRIPEFRQMRNQRLWKLLTERVEPMIGYADNVYATLDLPFSYDNQSPKHARERRVHRSFISNLRSNAELLMRLFRASELKVRSSLDTAGHLVIEVDNWGKARVGIAGIELQHDTRRVSLPLQNTQVVDGLWRGKPGYLRWTVNPATLSAHNISDKLALVGVIADNLVTGEPIDRQGIRLQHNPVTLAVSSDIPTGAMPSTLWLPANVRQEKSHIVFGPGPVHLRSTLKIPRPYSVVFAPGLRLSLDEDVSLIIHGDLASKGTHDQPVTIRGSSSPDAWGALVVQGTRLAPSSVHLEHTTMVGGTGAETARCVFTGALSITDAVVRVRDCQFMNAAGIDGINLKYCHVDFQNNFVSHTADDAVDFDFCQGIVVGNRVAHSGGDGIDFSGSDVQLSRNFIEQCADKGISVGEGTRAEVHHNVILHCKTGIASKDASAVSIYATGLAHLDVGIALYRKKLTFESPSVVAECVTMVDVATAYLQRPGTSLELSKSVCYVVGEVSSTESDQITYVSLEPPLAKHNLQNLLTTSFPGETCWDAATIQQLPW